MTPRTTAEVVAPAKPARAIANTALTKVGFGSWRDDLPADERKAWVRKMWALADMLAPWSLSNRHSSTC
jgi:hypothetical protein